VPPEELDDPVPLLDELPTTPVDEDDAPFPDEEEFIGALEDELDGFCGSSPPPPSSPEQEKVNAKARAKVAASANFEMMSLIVWSPFLK
jgi:hypothetical protein